MSSVIADTSDAGAVDPLRSTPVLLQVDSSPRAGSVTNLLTAAYAEAWAAARPGATVLRHDLPRLNLPHLNATEMGAWFTEPDDHTDLHHLVLARSNDLIEDLLAADELVIGAPMWNFSIPSSLKAWIDHVTKAGRTITFGPDGPAGLVPARRAVVVSARGSDYRPGTPTAALDMQEPYLRLILGFLGIAEVRCVNVDRQGPSYPEAGDYIEGARAELLELATGP
ncbi:FMN-dependent NADH-azoreductase [Dermatobacter hominis]|uniref:FMN-dependent NADH-azoreductase n=1 Tax=Dermatobacter hominis TaxID=2884263 RepID=UPI001D129701|nr:NAD(P)H-dependent oxidoreductase [Dermatobacter hominis]UDY37574.1 NAD(P)H-dependent oxidoreductase [Dermatobacter hominis]